MNHPGEYFTGGDEDKAQQELERFREAGGGTMVECSTEDLGRDPLALRRLSGAIVAVRMRETLVAD